MTSSSNQDTENLKNYDAPKVGDLIEHPYYKGFGVITKIDDNRLYIKFSKGIRIFLIKTKINSLIKKYFLQLKPEDFKEALDNFLKQADENQISKKSNGKKIIETPKCKLGAHYGQGNASRAPYLNWCVVSVYYITDENSIVIGIVKNFLDAPDHHLSRMNISEIDDKLLGASTKDKYVAVYYETSRDLLDYDELYEKFMSICDEVHRVDPKSSGLWHQAEKVL